MGIDTSNSVIAQLPYYSPPKDGALPYRDFRFDPLTGQRVSNFSQEIHEATVENVRGREESIKIDEAGFQFYKRETKVGKDGFDDEGVIKGVYYKESEELMKELLGAARVVIFDHTIRRRQPPPKDVDASNVAPQVTTLRQPVTGVHVDQTPKASINRVHRHLPASLAPTLLKKRFQIINLWRPISHAAYDWPLALCDYHSVDEEKDLVQVVLLYEDRQGETYNVRYNPNHKWKYLKGMGTDEFVLIKCFDSLRDGSVSLFTPHTGFADPTTPADAPLRQSIELRALVFYD